MIRRSRSLDASYWPALAAFFRGYLHQDAGEEYASIEAAFTSFWADASAEERSAFIAEWRALRARVHGRVWGKVEPLLASLGASWMPRGGTGFARLTRHIDSQVDSSS